MTTDATTTPGKGPMRTGISEAGLVVNNGGRILDFLKEQLRTCDEFWFGVAFLTSRGVEQLRSELDDAAGRGVKGQVFVSDYNEFTQPNALRQLREFANIDARLLLNKKYHGKGYLFRKNDAYRLIVGSANLTEAALLFNDELNMDVLATADSPVIQKYRHRFDQSFADAKPLTDETIDTYETRYKGRQESLGFLTGSGAGGDGADHLEPNMMQAKALESLAGLRGRDEDKALLISATGTGKTVLSALDVRQSKAKTMLFVAHRQDIIEQAKATFDMVFRGGVRTGLYDSPADAGRHDFLFATTQKLSRAAHLKLFDPGRFEYVIVDEAHHATASTYRKIMEHFRPGFLLGMTATPERMDQRGKDRDEDAIFQTFGNNVAYEIRLHEALESDLLTPFRYYGITKLAVEDGTQVDDLSRMRHLPRKELMVKVIAEIKQRKVDKMPVRGLVFCANIEEARFVTQELYKDPEIIANIDTSSRKSDEGSKGKLADWLNDDRFPENVNYKFLVAVDKYNEGVDIPRLNQVVMLRPTESITVFVQQLGRGLRLAKDKTFLTVLDFIGAHKKNYLIPNALYGYRTRGDNELRGMMTRASRQYKMPSGCVVEFDEISQQLIFKSINERGLVDRPMLSDYEATKRRVKRIPMLCDYDPRFDADPMLFVRRHGSYYGFLADRAEAGSAELPQVAAGSRTLLEEMAKTVNNGMRPDEPLLLTMLLDKPRVTEEEFHQQFWERFGNDSTCPPDLLALYLNMGVAKHKYGKNYQTPMEKHGWSIVEHVDGGFVRGRTIIEGALTQADEDFLRDNAEYAMRRFEHQRGDTALVDGFIRYGRYTSDDIQRLLHRRNYFTPINFTNGFIRRDEQGRAVDSPILLHYHNEKFEAWNVGFEDDGTTFNWGINADIGGKRVEAISAAGTVKHLFIRKHDKEAKDYMFMGKIISTANVRQRADHVAMTFTLDQPVEQRLLDYIRTKGLDTDKSLLQDEATPN